MQRGLDPASQHLFDLMAHPGVATACDRANRLAEDRGVAQRSAAGVPHAPDTTVSPLRCYYSCTAAPPADRSARTTTRNADHVSLADPAQHPRFRRHSPVPLSPTTRSVPPHAKAGGRLFLRYNTWGTSPLDKGFCFFLSYLIGEVPLSNNSQTLKLYVLPLVIILNFR